MKKVGLFFGSYNPIHIGHLVIANHLVEYTDLDEIWLVVTPHNPFKKKATLLADHHRFALVQRAVEDYPKLQASDIEFKLPQPNYTINTLIHLSEKYPNIDFSLIMGEDNLNTFHKWKNHEAILEHYSIYVYPRLALLEENVSILQNHPKITYTQAPVIEISSTMIRNAIAAGKNIQPLLPEKVWQYLDEMNFYK